MGYHHTGLVIVITLGTLGWLLSHWFIVTLLYRHTGLVIVRLDQGDLMLLRRKGARTWVDR
jgi:hypothetical protein